MSIVLKLIALVIVVALLAPVVGHNTEFGRVMGAVLQDARSFCERRPETCEATVKLVHQAGQSARGAISALANGEEPGNLTPDDRALRPASPPPSGYESVSPFAYGAHGDDERP
jgi:hypothetical protein